MNASLSIFNCNFIEISNEANTKNALSFEIFHRFVHFFSDNLFKHVRSISILSWFNSSCAYHFCCCLFAAEGIIRLEKKESYNLYAPYNVHVSCFHS